MATFSRDTSPPGSATANRIAWCAEPYYFPQQSTAGVSCVSWRVSPYAGLARNRVGARQFGTRRTQAHARYAQFVHDGQDQPGIWHGLRNQPYIGDEPFVAWMPSEIKDAKSLDEMPRVQRHLCCLALQDFPRECGNQQAGGGERKEGGGGGGGGGGGRRKGRGRERKKGGGEGKNRGTMAAAYSSGVHTMQAIAAYFGVHYSLTS